MVLLYLGESTCFDECYNQQFTQGYINQNIIQVEDCADGQISKLRKRLNGKKY